MSQAQGTEEFQRADVARLARAATITVDSFVLDNYDALNYVTKASRTALIVEAAIGYLIGEGLIRVTDEWPEYLSIGIPDHLMPDVEARVREMRRFQGESS